MAKIQPGDINKFEFVRYDNGYEDVHIKKLHSINIYFSNGLNDICIAKMESLKLEQYKDLKEEN